jgi:hypothetical protein
VHLLSFTAAAAAAAITHLSNRRWNSLAMMMLQIFDSA